MGFCQNPWLYHPLHSYHALREPLRLDRSSDGPSLRRQVPHHLCLVQAIPQAIAGANPARVSSPHTDMLQRCRQLPAASGVAWRKPESAEGWTGFCYHKCVQEIPLVMEGPCKWTTRAAQRCVVSQPGFLCLWLRLSLHGKSFLDQLIEVE